jgi:hemerythrin
MKETLHRSPPEPEDIALVLQAGDGRILEANPAAESAYGRSLEELLALTIFDLRADTDRSLTLPQLAVAERHEVLIETTQRRRDGSTFRARMASRPAVRKARRVVLSTVHRLVEEEEDGPGEGALAQDAGDPQGQRSIVWTDDLAIGIRLIDEQHQRVCDAVAHLRDAMKGGQLWMLPSVLHSIENYALKHFGTEEGVMERLGFPGLPEHRKVHQGFAVAFQGHQAALATTLPRRSAVLELSDWMTHWIREHIREMDGEIGRFARDDETEADGRRR